MTAPRYPTGECQLESSLTEDARRASIDSIATLPADLERAVSSLPPERLDAPYRPGGWTVRQLVHHIADSHLNAYIRFKLGITEDGEPAVRTYDRSTKLTAES